MRFELSHKILTFAKFPAHDEVRFGAQIIRIVKAVSLLQPQRLTDRRCKIHFDVGIGAIKFA